MPGTVALASAACLIGIPATLHATGLPEALVAAAALGPADGDKRRVCVSITGLHDQLPVSTVRPAPAGSTDGAYGLATSGIWLGDGPVGTPPPPFVQAMLDAGAAEAMPVAWVERRTVQVPAVPQDAGAVGVTGRAPPPGHDVRDVEVNGVAYVVSGSDRDLFQQNPNDWTTPIPLRVLDGVPARNAPWSKYGEIPPGLKGATAICFSLVPDRVLEYEDPLVKANGLREVSAAILFHPSHMPRWASDYRTFDAMQFRIEPDVVMVMTFRWDGNGWHPEPYPKWGALQGHVHLVGQD